MKSKNKPQVTTLAGNEIIPASVFGGEVQKYDASVLSMITSTGYLPRVQLQISTSDKVKKGEFPVNHYALINGQQTTDLGKDVDVIAIAWRPKAMEITTEAVVNFYDPKTPEFQAIMQKAETQNSGCMFGPEILIWVPSAPDKLATLFFGSKSARREFSESNLISKLRQPITLKSKYIEGKKYSWQAMQVVNCSTPIEAPEGEWLEKLTEEVHKFNNPPKQDVEAADEPATARER